MEKLFPKTLFYLSLILLFGCASVSKDSNFDSAECPKIPEGKLDFNNIESINIQGQAATKSNRIRVGKYVGYTFDAQAGQKLSYSTDKDLCIWIYTPDNRLLQGLKIPEDGNYIIQVSTALGSTTFDLEMHLEDPIDTSSVDVAKKYKEDRNRTRGKQQCPESIGGLGVNFYETRNFWIYIYNIDGEYYYHGVSRKNKDSSITLPVSQLGNSFVAFNGNYRYEINQNLLLVSVDGEILVEEEIR